jgi:hypothetical protein
VTISAILPLLLGCSEQTVRVLDEVPVAAPPGEEADEFGSPPDWADCTSGYAGRYFNLPDSHGDIEPGEDVREADTYDELDWWDAQRLSFERFDPSLDHGSNWWPVDDGLSGDPAYFTSTWVAWIRVWEDTEVAFTAGASDDLWVDINGETVIALPGVKEFDPETFTVSLDNGQYPIEVRFAHRSGDSALRFRPLDSSVTICHPDFSEDTG